MQYKRLKDGTHAVGMRRGNQFVVCASAFDAREAKALANAINAVFELFYRTSGGYVTMVGINKERLRGASSKVQRKAKRNAR